VEQAYWSSGEHFGAFISVSRQKKSAVTIASQTVRFTSSFSSPRITQARPHKPWTMISITTRRHVLRARTILMRLSRTSAFEYYLLCDAADAFASDIRGGEPCPSLRMLALWLRPRCNLL
jgi:hypothetical protein